MFENINFEPGIVTYNDFDININIQLKEQIGSLKEDLFQVQYSEKYIIDVGWYPSFSWKGSFRIFVVKDDDWTRPLFDKRCKNIQTLNQYMEDCANLVRALL